MAAVQQRVLNWLYSVLTSDYQDVNRTYSDVAQTLSHYSSLTPRTEVFTYENGASALLLHISGTLPVTFRGTTYRFPVSLWIPHAYPKEAPLVYVTPAEGMMIRAGQHVDPQGKLYHPYLVGWAEFWDKSTILDFLAILRDVFAKEPPVISKQQRNAPPNISQYTPMPPLVPPHPPNITARPSLLSDGTLGPPPPPPKNHGSDGRSQTSPQNTTTGRESGPPLPPLPPGTARPLLQSQPPVPSYQNGHQPGRQSSLRYETAPPVPRQPSTQVFQSPPYSPPNNAGTTGNIGALQYSPPPAGQYNPGTQDTRRGANTFSQSYAPQQQAYQVQRPQWQQFQQQQQEQQQQQQPSIQPKPKPPPPDIIDQPLTFPTPSDTPLVAPPIPPNPEKDMLLHSLAQALYAQRQHSLLQTNSSLPSLRAQRSSMLHSLTTMNSEIHALESLSALLNSNTAILHTSLHEADAVIKSSQGRAPPGVDEILVAPTAVSNQLYELVCEERSLGDALFMLSKAMGKDRVGASAFTKATRGLAREWYLKKALVKKIVKGMGLVTERNGYGR